MRASCEPRTTWLKKFHMTKAQNKYNAKFLSSPLPATGGSMRRNAPKTRL